MLDRIILFTFFTISFFTNTHAQDYIPTLVEGAEWNEAYSFEGTAQYDFIAGRDTIINNLTYRNIYGSNGIYVQAIMREDSVERKIYRLDIDNNMNEELLYDYSLSVGDYFGDLRLDSITTTLNIPELTVSFLTLDTRVFYFSRQASYDAGLIWIEGIGSNNGLLRFAQDEFLLCHHNANGDLDLIVDPAFINVVNCMVVGVSDIPDLIEGDLFPNPTSVSLSLELQEFIQEGRVSISDITGRNVKVFSFKGDEVKVNVEDIDAGIYIVQIHDSGKLVGSRKFVKN